MTIQCPKCKGKKTQKVTVGYRRMMGGGFSPTDYYEVPITKERACSACKGRGFIPKQIFQKAQTEAREIDYASERKILQNKILVQEKIIEKHKKRLSNALNKMNHLKNQFGQFTIESIDGKQVESLLIGILEKSKY